MPEWLKILRIVLWSALILAVGYFLFYGIIPFGRIEYSNDFSSPDYFIGKLTPKERVIADDGKLPLVAGNPVYFNLKTTRPFSKAGVTLRYRRTELDKDPVTVTEDEARKTLSGSEEAANTHPETNDAPIIELGMLADKNAWRYDLKPVENKLLDGLGSEWRAEEWRGAVFYSRKDGKVAADGLLKDPDRYKKAAVYNFNPETRFTIKGYTASRAPHSQPLSLRGPHEFYVYAKNEKLYFEFELLDLNLDKDNEFFEIIISRNGEVIDRKEFGGDGLADDSGRVTELGKSAYESALLEEGVYKVGIRTNYDMVFRLTTRQEKISYINHIRIHEIHDRPRLFSDIKRLYVKTADPKNLQEAKFGSETIFIAKPFKQYYSGVSHGAKEITFEKGGLILAGEGVFSFGPENLLNPGIRKISQDTDLDKEGIEYIIADYAKPEEDGGWMVKRVDFDLTKAYKENRTYSFLISIPGLEASKKGDTVVEISRISVELTGNSLYEKVRRLISEKL